MNSAPVLRFAPSRVEGLENVEEVVCHPDRLEVLAAGTSITIRFADIARWPNPRWLSRAVHRLGWKRPWLPVADRDWFHPPRDRFFRFYTKPPIVVYMPVDDPYPRDESTFGHLQEVLAAGGFSTFDLG
jgi:hypothetical protein